MSTLHRLVLIDDDCNWRETLAEYLRTQGFRVATAPSGTPGLALLEEKDVGLAVVDFHMPEINGLELLRRLRRQRQDVAVLMLSSDDDPMLPLRAKAEGASAFLSKSMAPSLLLHTLVQALLDAEASLRRHSASWQGRLLPMPRRSGHWLPILFQRTKDSK